MNYLEINEIKLPLDNIEELLELFDPDLSQATLSFILPVRQLALYLIERFFHLPQIIQIFETRTRVLQDIRSIIEPYLDELEEDKLDILVVEAFDNYYSSRGRSKKITKLFMYSMTFLHFFLQLANSIRRGAELTYIFLYEYNSKLETLLKLEDRANYIITKFINGVEYIQLVFDTTYKENLLQFLPVQFLRPKIGMVISSMSVVKDFDHELFDPEFLFIVSKDYKFSKQSKDAYFVQYNTSDFWNLYSVPSDEYFFVKKIMY